MTLSRRRNGGETNDCVIRFDGVSVSDLHNSLDGKENKIRRGVQNMQAYHIRYNVRNSINGDKILTADINAKDLKSAKKKIGRKHGYKDGRMILIRSAEVVGYF